VQPAACDEEQADAEHGEAGGRGLDGARGVLANAGVVDGGEDGLDLQILGDMRMVSTCRGLRP